MPGADRELNGPQDNPCAGPAAITSIKCEGKANGEVRAEEYQFRTAAGYFLGAVTERLLTEG
jgi:hypothetical protein